MFKIKVKVKVTSGQLVCGQLLPSWADVLCLILWAPSQQNGFFTGGKRSQNPGSKPGQHPGQAAQNLPQIRAGCPEPWGRQIFAQFAFWQAARIWGRFWAGLPKVLPGVLPRVSSELPSPGGGKELAVADSISHNYEPSVVRLDENSLSLRPARTGSPS